jgi:uncharacterized membrane protein
VVAAISAAVARRAVGSAYRNYMFLLRLLKHLLTPDWLARRPFTPAVLTRIEAAIRQSETAHRGEIRFALEGGLELGPLLHGLTPRARAIEVFSHLHVWDTEENTGVLVYLQLIDRDFEIIADRGIAARVPQAQWETICQRVEATFRAGRFEDGVTLGLREISALLAQHFPARAANSNELPDKPVVL